MDKKVLIDGKFWASQQQSDTLEALSKVHGGSFARIDGYRPTSNYVSPPTVNYTILTRFSVERLYQRRLAALNAITLSDVIESAKNDPELAALTLAEFDEHFQNRLSMQKASIEKSLAGDRDDNYREAHDRCYYTVAPGIKVHFQTADFGKGKEKHKEPVLHNGFPVADSIMLNALIISTETIVEGEKKVVKSGIPVLIGNCIEGLLNQKSVGYRSLSLKHDNFTSIKVEGGIIVPDDIVPLMEAQ